MAQEWWLEGPRVLDIGGDGERVGALRLAIVAGRFDVVTHDDSPTARVEVSALEGQPLRVRWDGATLRITHGPRADSGGLLDRLREGVEGLDRNCVTLSVSVPQEARVRVTTVSAGGLVSGVRGRVTVATVSGPVTVDDVDGAIDVNTVSGDVECFCVRGDLRVKAVSGSVTAQECDLRSVGIHTVSGDTVLDLTSGGAAVSSSSVAGDLTVRAPHDGYSVRARTASGQVVVDGRELRRGPHSAGGELTEGNGSLRVSANAVSGSIVVLGAEREAEA